MSPPATPADLVGGDAEHNADVVRRLLAGEIGSVRDAVLLNAAAAIAAYDGVLGSAEQAIAHGLPIATAAVEDGSAARLLDRWVALSQQLRGLTAAG